MKKFAEVAEKTLRGSINDILALDKEAVPDPMFDGKINYLPFSHHLVPQRGLAKVAAVMRCGERSGRDGWEQVPINEQLNHALAHINMYLAGVGVLDGEPHLAHAGCRILMALDLDWKEVLPKPEFEPQKRKPERLERKPEWREAGQGQSCYSPEDD